MVVSHDCDFNEGNREFFLVARVQELSRGQKVPDKLDHMKKGNDPRARTAAGKPIGLNMFVLDPVPGTLGEHAIGNFELIIPVAVRFRGDLFKLKIAEMDDQHRKWLRKKLAIFVGRPEDDILDELKVPKPDEAAKQVWKEIPEGV